LNFFTNHTTLFLKQAQKPHIDVLFGHLSANKKSARPLGTRRNLWRNYFFFFAMMTAAALAVIRSTTAFVFVCRIFFSL